ncbi:MAG: hypothetical protein GC206_06260 [Alphaproteobacteria bacterium]|nr:hypothetical protein [Alphaproteobacteria bacterium]
MTAPDTASPAPSAPRPFDRFKQVMRRSMSARLAFVAVLCTLALIVVAIGVNAFFTRQMTRLLIEPQLVSMLDQMQAASAPGEDGRFVFEQPRFDARFNQGASGYYYQVERIDQNFDVVARSPSLYGAELRIDAIDRARLTERDSAGFVTERFIDISPGPDRWPIRVAARVGAPQALPGEYLYIVAIAPSVPLQEINPVIFLTVTLFVAFSAAAVVAITWLQVQIGLEPLRKLQRDVADVRRGKAERLEGEYAAELTPVAHELNALLQHNREVVERARRHVGNLAHALKTPIAVLKNAADDKDAEPGVLKGAVLEMEAFVERQLRRARVAARAEARAGVEAGALGYRTPVKQNLEDLVFMMEQRYDHEKALDIMLEAPVDVTFRGEREDLLEMAANLIDNACKYGRSQVRVTVTPAPSAGALMEIVVEDDGPGLSDAEIAQVLQRGTRLDEAAPGQGLGLSILSEAVSLYAGELLFERSDLGGLKARLRLPATD